MKHIKLKALVLSSFLLIAATTGLSLLHKDSISALDNDFSNGITVDSTLDTSDADTINSTPYDGICDDGDGNCTLRAAIEEANSDPDASTILFNIQEPADFTNNSQDGYTIKPQSALPEVTEQVTINGYSQPGAQANSAIAPNPLNGTLLIEVDGGDAGGDAFGFVGNASGSRLSGVIAGNWVGNGVYVGTDSIEVKGN